ncbi:hypothetical protein LCGC14_0464530 [marine sediment metagenome]|uniref:Uncharacterized protein n=1 Tax=marine sediment metagenome TaxID=412755 RepID=A0A0F9V0Q2_9ZZZZ
MKSQSKTHMERMGFNDNELSTPEHDELCLYFYKNYEGYLRKLIDDYGSNLNQKIRTDKFPYGIHLSEYYDDRLNYGKLNESSNLIWPKDKQFESIDDFLNEASKNINNKEKVNAVKELIRQDEFKCNIGCETTQKLNVGQYDMEPYFYCPNVNHRRFADSKIKWEHPITSRTGYMIGYVDFLVTYSYSGKESNRFLVEIKPKIKSLGELFRQLNTYRAHQKGKIVLVTYEKLDEEIFKDQDVIYIHVERGKN